MALEEGRFISASAKLRRNIASHAPGPLLRSSKISTMNTRELRRVQKGKLVWADAVDDVVHSSASGAGM